MKYPPFPFKITAPDELVWNPLKNYRLIRHPNGRFKHDFDVKNYEFAGFNYYIDVNNGNDNNGGLTLANAFKTINKAITQHGSTAPASQSGGVRTRSTEHLISGDYSWKVVTPGTIADEGMKATPDPTTVNGRNYTANATIYSPTGGNLKIVFAGVAESYNFSEGETKTLTKTVTASATRHSFHVRTHSTAQAKTFYVDDFTLIDNLTGLNVIKSYQSTAEPLIINVADGFYNKSNGFNDTELVVDTVIKAISGNPIISAENSQTWSLSSGQTNTYQSDETNQVYRVFDSIQIDANGDYLEYTKQSSIEDVESNPGSWYWANNILYVHCLNNRTPDTDIHGYLAVKGVSSTNRNVYLEGITLHGGGNSASTSNGPINHVSSGSTIYNLYMKNCTVKYSVNDNKGVFVNKSTAYIQNCLSAKNDSDGFNYHTAPKILELKCVGRDNGYAGESNDNGSSIHGGGTIIRINGEYTRNYGPNVVDINEGTQSWNIGCKSYNSLSELSSNNNDFMLQQGMMWLDNCKSYGSDYGMVCDNTSPIGTMYLRQTKESSPRIITGNIINY